MAEESRGPGRPSNESLMAKGLEKIGDALAQLQQNQPRKEIGFGDPEFQQRLHDEGFFDELEKPAFQNGREVVARGLKKETIHRLARLRPGRYCQKRVEVLVDNREQRHLLYKSATPEDRMRFAIEVASDFDMLIGKIWAEMSTAPVTAEQAPDDAMTFSVV